MARRAEKFLLEGLRVGSDIAGCRGTAASPPRYGGVPRNGGPIAHPSPTHKLYPRRSIGRRTPHGIRDMAPSSSGPTSARRPAAVVCRGTAGPHTQPSSHSLTICPARDWQVRAPTKPATIFQLHPNQHMVRDLQRGADGPRVLDGRSRDLHGAVVGGWSGGRPGSPWGLHGLRLRWQGRATMA